MASVNQEFEQLVAGLTDEQFRQLVGFAKFLRWSDERHDWRDFGLAQFAKAYGDNEPEYTLADVREDTKR